MQRNYELRWAIVPLAAATLALTCTAGQACNVPVFRYALERWDVDPYELVVFHEGSLSEEKQRFLVQLDERRVGNEFYVRTIDVAADLTPENSELYDAAKPEELPWLYVQYPDSGREDPPAYAGPFDENVLAGLLDSPKRREIAKLLLEGESIVWLLVESGDEAKDDAVGELVAGKLKLLEKELALPELDDSDAQYLTAEAGPELRLSLAFVRMSRDEVGEQMFLRLLENWSPQEVEGIQPMMFAFFGRGRVLGPLVGDAIDKPMVEDACMYLTGPCSCQIKGQNPGWDMLMRVDWFAALAGQEMATEVEPWLTTPQAVAEQQAALTALGRELGVDGENSGSLGGNLAEDQPQRGAGDGAQREKQAGDLRSSSVARSGDRPQREAGDGPQRGAGDGAQHGSGDGQQRDGTQRVRDEENGETPSAQDADSRASASGAATTPPRLDFIPIVIAAIVLVAGLIGVASGVIWQRNREHPSP